MKDTKKDFLVIALFALFAVVFLFGSCSKNEEGGNSNSSSTKTEGGSSLNRSATDDEDEDDDSGDWNKILDAYEKVIDDQIEIIKKVKAGDATAMMKQAENLQKLEDVANKLSGASGSMSAAQLKRFTDLQNKYTKALTQ